MPRSLLAFLALTACYRSTSMSLPAPAGARSALFFLERGESAAPSGIALSAEAERWTLGPFAARSDTLLAMLIYDDSLDQLLLDPGPLELAEAQSGPSGRPLPEGAVIWTRGAADESEEWIESELPVWLSDVQLPSVTELECRAHGGCFVVPEEASEPRCKVPCTTSCADFEALDRLPPGPIPLLPDCIFNAPARGDECWSEPVRFEALSSGLFPNSHDEPGSFTVERGRTFLYLASDRERGADDANYTRPARVEITGTAQLVADSYADLGVIPAASLDPLGWISPPRVRDDAAELFVYGSWPDAHYWDEEIYVSTQTGGVWSTLSPIDAIADLTNGQDPTNLLDQDEVRSPLLLPDYRTLIFTSPTEIAQQQQFARRPSTQPGDVRFAPLRVSPFELNRVATYQYSLSCDRRHIFYVLQSDAGQELRIVSIRSLEPLAFGQPTAVKDLHGDPLRLGNVAIVHLAESPDCSTLYVGDTFRTYYSTRVPCAPR